MVTGEYQVGMQDQAFLGPESGLAVQAEDGGVELYVATQWLHVDQKQICSALGLPPDMVQLPLAGVGGAFGGREDLSMHVHAFLLALRTGLADDGLQPGGVVLRARAPASGADALGEHGADRDGRLVYVKGPDLPGRRGVRVQHPGGGRERGHDGHRPVRGAERAG